MKFYLILQFFSLLVVINYVCSLSELMRLVAAALRSLLFKRSFSTSFPWLVNDSALGSTVLRVQERFSGGDSAVEFPTGDSESTGDNITIILSGDGGRHGNEHTGGAVAKKIK